jgi:hypothetical protein
MNKFLEKTSPQKKQIFFWSSVIILGVCFFILQISITKNKIEKGEYVFFPPQKFEKVIEESGGKKESIVEIYTEAKKDITDAFKIDEALLEDLKKEINKEENGEEKE